MTGFGELNLKTPLILAILNHLSCLNFMLIRVECEKSFITWGHDITITSIVESPAQLMMVTGM